MPIRRVARLLLSLALVLLTPSAATADSKRALSAGEIEKLLGSGVSQGRVANLVDERGVTFEVTPAVKDQLRAAGAGDQVLGAVDRASLQAERRKLEAERQKLEDERKAGESAAEAEKKRQAAAEAAAKKAEAEAKKKAERERAKREAAEDGGGEDSAPPAKAAAKSKGGGSMVTVPGGSFFMGCNQSVDSECDDDEKPGKTVEVAAFKIDKTEVTVAQYARCVDAGRCSSAGLTMPFYNGKEQPEFAEFCNWQRPGREEHPINCVDWNQAVAYCEWAGKRLPTEAEWEKAARGTDGRRYSWGNAGYGAGGRVANIADETAKRSYPQWTIASGYDDGYVGTAPVGSFPAGASPSGALDMIGNGWEWTSDPFQGGRAVRGASWGDEPRNARASNRDRVVAANRSSFDGFRCAQ